MKKKGFLRLTAFALVFAMLVAFAPIVPVQTAYAADPIAQTIELSANKIGSEVATNAKVDVHGWEVDKDGTGADLYANLSNPNSTAIPQFFKTYDAGKRNGFSLGHMAAYFNWGADSKVLSLKINNAVAGVYDIGAVMYEYPGSTIDGTVAVNGTDVGMFITEATSTAAYTDVTKKLADNVELNEGVNTITFKTSTTKNGFNLAKIILTPAGGEEEGEEEVAIADKIKLDFKIYDKLPDHYSKRGNVRIIPDATYALGGWMFNEAMSDSTMAANIKNLEASSGLYWQYRFDADLGLWLRFADGWWNDDNNKVLAFNFIAAASGMYDLAGVLSSVYDPDTYGLDIEVLVKNGKDSEVSLGKFLKDSYNAGDAAAFKSVYLTQGVNTLILKGAKGVTSIVTVDNFTFTPVAAEEIKLDFMIYDKLPDRSSKKGNVRIIPDATYEMGGWKINETLSDSTMVANITNLQASSGLYWQYRFDPDLGLWMRFADGWWSDDNNKVLAFDFDVAASGAYNLTGVLSSVYDPATYGLDIEVLVKSGNADPVSLGKFEASSYTAGDVAEFDSVHLNSGTHTLILKGAKGATSVVTIDSFTFVPVEPEAIKLDFKIYDKLPTRSSGKGGIRVIPDATYEMGGWMFNETLSDSVMVANIKNLQASSAVYNQYRFDPDLGLWMRFADGWWADDYNKVLAFDFVVPTSGRYELTGVLSSVYEPDSFGLDIEVLVKSGNAEPISLGKFEKNSYKAGEVAKFGNVGLASGKHTLLLKGAKGVTSIVTIDNFTFTPPATSKVNAMLTLESSAALVGEEIGFRAWVNMEDGSTVQAGDLTGKDSLTVTSSNESVAVIENGKIKALGEGRTEIKVLADIGGKKYTAKAAFNVVSVPAGEFKLVADASWPIKPGRRAQVLVQGAYSDVVINMQNAQNVTVESSSNDIATATTVYKNGNLYVEVKGVNKGNAEITLKAEYNGVPASVVIPVNIDPEGVEGAPTSLDLTGSTWENLSLILHGIGVNKELTNPEIMLRHGWVVYLGSSAKIELKKNEAVYFDVNIPADGEYVFSINAVHNVIGFTAAMYIDGEFVGEHNFADMGDNPPANRDDSIDSSEKMRNIKLKAGTHLLKIERISDSGTFLWMKSFTFSPVAASPKVVGIAASSDKTSFTPGETVNNKFSVRLSDGTEYHIPKIIGEQGTMSVTNRMPERMDYSANVMKAKKKGMAFFEVNADVPVSNGKLNGIWTANISDGQLYDFTVAQGSAKPGTSGIYEKGWAVNGEKTTINTSDSGYLLDANGFNAGFANGEILAVDMYVENSGIYNVDAAISPIADGCVADVYVGDKYLGRVDFAADENVELNTVELAAGETTVYIKKVGGGSKMSLKQLAIIRVEKLPEFSHTTFENETNEIALNKTLQAVVKVWMDNARQLHIGPNRDGSIDSSNKIDYSAEPAGVFSVDNAGLMKGITVGTSTLKAKVTVNGNVVDTPSKDFSVINVLALSTDGIFKILRGETTNGSLTATLDDVPVDITKASSITVTSPDSKAEGEVKIENGKAVLYITGIRGGETSINVEAVYNGIVGNISVPVTVIIPTNSDDDIILDFMPTNTKRPSTPQAANLDTHGWQTNLDKTSPNPLNSPMYKMGTYGLQTQVEKGEQFAFDIWVKKSGSYAVEMMGTSIGPSGIFAGFYVDGVYMGEFNFAHPTSMSDSDIIPNQIAKLNSINLASGKHTITIKKLAKSGTYKYALGFWLGHLKFMNLNSGLEFDYVQAKAGKDTLCVGESTSFDANAYMTDGSIRYMEDGADANNKITITNSNPTVAELRNGRIYALSQGQTTITVTAKVDGEEKIAFADITVDDKVLNSVEATLDGDLCVGQSAELDIKAFADDREIDIDSVNITTTSDWSGVVLVSGTKVTGLSAGTATITVTAQMGNGTASKDIIVNVTEDGIASLKVEIESNKIRPGSGAQIKLIGGSFQGQPIDITDAQVTYETDATNIVSISENGYVTGLAIGEAVIKVNVKKGLFEESKEITVTVTNGKVGRSYYTDQKVENALENISKFEWAKSERDSAVKSAEMYLDKMDLLWNMVTTHTLPRSSRVGYRYDPGAGYCRYCNVDLTTFGDLTYAWLYDAFNAPYKVQCPSCRRRFPSNDFEKFYALGIDANGEWDYELAKQKNAELVENGEKGYLVNVLYPEVASVGTINNGRGLNLRTETVEGWGVDDGFGYKPGYTYKTPSFGDFEESHTYVAYYNRFAFASVFNGALSTLSRAYMFTDDIKYARVGAVLLDRIADVYPDMYWSEHFPTFAASDGSYPKGRIEGRIWETSTVKWFVHAYDALYPAFDDPVVINYLSEKAYKYNMENPKKTGDDIRKNIEDGILREVFKAIVDGDIHGNFGMHQQRIADVGVILDSMPESKEILDYLMAKDTAWVNDSGHTGGDVMDKLINGVDRDGGSEEGISPNYSMIWYNCISDIAEVINGYEGYQAADLFKHPVVQKMLENLTHLVHTRNTTAAVGDSGLTAGLEVNLPSTTSLMRGFRATNNVLLAQTLYYLNGDTTEGIHENIYTKNPEAIQEDLQDIIDEHGEYPFDASLMHAEQGYAILRDGSLYGKGSLQEKNVQRDFWMQFGFYGIHSHPDMLNLGIHAYGLDFAPDLGYPTQADGGDEYINWGHGTINHNTVIVDDSKQLSSKVEGFPLHFDDAGRVKVMDVDASVAYNQTDMYRRTVVMVEVDDDISYGVDFFRVMGGKEHLYSFHSQSNTISSYGGFTPEEQIKGTYAGENVPYRTPGVVTGYSYLTDVRKAEAPGTNEFYVDYLVEDFRGTIKDSKDLHMRLTMLNDFELSEISLVKGETPVRGNNPRWLEYMLARRSSTDGKELDTTFTTVLEPYKGARYIKNTAQVEVKRADSDEPVNANGDVVRAIKVELENGRTDYIVYASNVNEKYIVDGKFTFQGFAGVCSYMDGTPVYSYLNDGVELKDDATQFGISMQKEFTGEVVDFTRVLTSDNKIIVKIDGGFDLETLKNQIVGRWMYIENNIGMKNGNAAYLIKDITQGAQPGTFDISLGNTTLIRSGTNVTLESGDFEYNIAPKQWFNIPMSASADTAPVFTDEQDKMDIFSGRKFNKTVSAVSPIGKEITLTATSLPRGATFDAETGVISWTPDDRQIGDHHITIMADDGALQTALHFDLTVYKSSSGSGSSSGGNAEVTPSTPSTPSGGGSAGGGGSTTPSTPTTPETPDEPTTPDAPATGEGEGAGSTHETPAEKFVDLGNHTWAKDAIYSLVDKSVVNGTSSNTYAPANNIKRADFAIMLVRAFGITEGEGENFADVSDNKYYAEELRLAKAAGIVNGIGNDKFNPEGEITRQDMMLMLSRALDAMEVELSDADLSALADFADAAQISDYAADAVSRMIKDGIIAGANGKINPLAKATRAEIAVMLDRVLAK